MSKVQFKYAFDDNEHIIDIEYLSEKDRADYVCIGCGNILRPILPKTDRKKHFRHKHEQECSFETYLHRMGKRIFELNYKQCLENNKPFIIEYYTPVNCNGCKHGDCPKGGELNTFDLTTAFKKIDVEEHDDRFIADLLLKTVNGDKIYIEIAVTHESSNDKIESKIKIIEFLIQSEEDLVEVDRKFLSYHNDKINYYNFSPAPILKKMTNSCKNYVTYFHVYQNGKCRLTSSKIFDYDKIEKDPNEYVNLVPPGSKGNFAAEVKKAYKNGIMVKDCHLCRYHVISAYFSFEEPKPLPPIFCKIYRKRYISNQAAICDRYRPDDKVFTNT